MEEFSFLPAIRCSCCSSIIGDKYFEFLSLLNSGIDKLTAFEIIRLNNYCCRAKIANCFVIPSRIFSNKIKIINPPKKPSKEELFVIEFQGDIFNRKIKQVVKIEDKPKTLRELRIELNSFLKEDHEEFNPSGKLKDVDVDKIYDSLISDKGIEISVGEGLKTFKRNRVYKAI